jgi:hypothetical protein
VVTGVVATGVVAVGASVSESATESASGTGTFDGKDAVVADTVAWALGPADVMATTENVYSVLLDNPDTTHVVAGTSTEHGAASGDTVTR